jgi:hypothetical protein
VGLRKDRNHRVNLASPKRTISSVQREIYRIGSGMTVDIEQTGARERRMNIKAVVLKRRGLRANSFEKVPNRGYSVCVGPK